MGRIDSASGSYLYYNVSVCHGLDGRSFLLSKVSASAVYHRSPARWLKPDYAPASLDSTGPVAWQSSR